MRVWIVNQTAVPPSMGGLVRHYYFSKYLRKDGHDVRIFTGSHVHNTEKNMIDNNDLYLEKEVDGIPYTFVRIRDYVGNGKDRILSMIKCYIKNRSTLFAMVVAMCSSFVIACISPSSFLDYSYQWILPALCIVMTESHRRNEWKYDDLNKIATNDIICDISCA